MKKAISLILLLVLCFSLVACGDSTTEIPEQTDVPPSTAESNSLSAEEIAAVSGEWYSVEFGGILKVIDATTIIVPDSESGSEYTMTYVGGSESRLEFTLTDNDGNTVGTIRLDTQTDFEYPMYFHLIGRGESYCSFYGDEERYQSVLNYLGRLEIDGQTAVALPAEDALRLMEKLTTLGDYKDSAEILSRFVVLPQMYTGATLLQIDNLGNEFEKKFASYTYDASGKMASAFEYYQGMYLDTDHMETYGQLSGVGGGFYFQYDDNGIITGVQYGNISALFTPSYDADGKLTSILAKYNEGTYEHTFAYNDAGLRTSATIPVLGGTYIYKYIYNDEGVLVQKEIETKNTYDSLVMSVIITYEYDVNNNILQTTTSATRYNQYYGTETHVYIYDDQGCRISAEITTDEPGVIFASQTVTYHYEDIYFYNPSN